MTARAGLPRIGDFPWYPWARREAADATGIIYVENGHGFDLFRVSIPQGVGEKAVLGAQVAACLDQESLRAALRLLAVP